MRPNVLFVPVLMIFSGPGALYAVISGIGHGDIRIILTGLAVLAFLAWLFYSLVYFEIKVYRDRLRTYESSGEWEALTAEFQNAPECFNRGRIRLGSRHIFVKGESEAYPYGDILAIRVAKDSDGVSLYINRKGKPSWDCFRSVKWRKRNDPEIGNVVSAIRAHNPEIEADTEEP